MWGRATRPSAERSSALRHAGDNMVKRTTLRSCLRFPALIGIFATTAVCAQQSEHVKNYKGTPYQDGRYQSGAQKIPGRVECAY